MERVRYRDDFPFAELLERLTREIDDVVTSRGGSVELAVGGPATEAAMVDAEGRMQRAIPIEYRQFLSVCDGIRAVVLGPRGEYATSLTLASLKEVESINDHLVSTLDAIRAGSLLDEEWPVFDADGMLHRYFAFSDCFNRMLDLASPTAGEERVIFGDCGDSSWLTKPLQIARSFRAYVFRSIVCMLEYGTFAYETAPHFERIEDH